MRTSVYFILLFIAALAAGLIALVDFNEVDQQIVYEYRFESNHHDQDHKDRKCRKKRRKRSCHERYSQSFNKIKVNSPADIVLRKANRQSEVGVRVEGCRIKKSTYDGMLHIDSENRHCNSNSTVYITYGDLEAIYHNGSGNLNVKSAISTDDFLVSSNSSGKIYINNIKVGHLKTNIKGSAEIFINGRVGQLTVYNYGSGDLRAYNLTCDYVQVENKSSGDIMVTANDLIKANIYGSGDVKFKGDAGVTIHKSHTQSSSGKLIRVK